MQLAKSITYNKKGQLIETFLFDETRRDPQDPTNGEKAELVENKHFKSLLSYGRYLDKLQEKYGDSLIELPTIVEETKATEKKDKNR